MPLALTAGLKPLLMITGIAVLSAIGAGGYAWWVDTSAEQEIQEKQQRIAELKVNRNQWQRTAWRWHEDKLRLQEERDAAREAVADLKQAQATNDAQYEPIKQMIEQAPASDDGPVAPVLRRTIEALP